MGIFGKKKKYFNNTETKIEKNPKMGNKFTRGLEHMKNFSSQYLTIVTFAGIILGGYKIYEAWNKGNGEMQEKVEIMVQNQKSQQRTDSLLLQNQFELRRDLEEHLKTSDEIARQLQALQKSYVRYISNDDALTKQDFLEYMEGLSMEEKKNSSSVSMTKME